MRPSFLHRYWSSLTSPVESDFSLESRGRAGYSFWQRYWASLIGTLLRPRLSDDHVTVQPRPKPGTHVRRARGVVMLLSVALVFTFVLLLVVMFASRLQTDRAAFLLTGLVALVFTALGVLFGISVQRSRMEELHRRADHERARADANEQAAAAGRALAAVIRAFATQAAQSAEDESTEGSLPNAQTIDPDLADLVSTTERLFPTNQS